MTDRDTEITRDEAAAVLWHFATADRTPGPFVTQLVVLIVMADHTNRRRLAQGFPGYVAAVDIAKNDIRGIHRLERIAYGHPDPDGRSTGHAGDQLAADTTAFALETAAQAIDAELAHHRDTDKANLKAHVADAQHDYDIARDAFMRGDAM